MLLTKAYYLMKPLMPFSWRMALRRRRGNHRRKIYGNVWPIDEAAGGTPPGWPGWPDGKRFAFVLTHDVEGAKGVDRVPRLMDLEREHGFTSSFNFVPHGEYVLSAELRHRLDEAGFEVGVHGLDHNGKLYSSKASFVSQAAQIRQYLKEWNAVGFRSPFMQHKLSWLHQLGVEYDASTFDTDPFEPQPDGVGTVFPFWVAGPHDSGYVELPYSLVQDFNLFVVLQEPNIDIWKRKLDWIVERGGMALLNTHPDYMCFDGKPARDEFPVRHYEEFLRYVQDQYGGTFWSATPRDVSRYYCSSLPVAQRNSRKKVCMVAYTQYNSDNRVRRYAEALAKRGDHVEVIALGGVSTATDELKGVKVHRILSRNSEEKRKRDYVLRLARFCLASSILLNRRHSEVQYDLIHVHNMPDFLIFTGWYAKLTGAKLLLDIHDLTPELFASKFKTRASSYYVKALRAIEKVSAAFADHVIVSNDLWRKTLVSRSAPDEKCSVFLNHVDREVFYRRPRTRNDDKFIMVFPGSFQWHQGLDIAIKALVEIVKQVPNAELHLYGGGGRGDALARLAELADSLQLDGKVRFMGDFPLEQIAEVIANADLGVVPKRADSFGNEAYSTKIMEFMSQGIPVVASRTKIDTFYFDETVVRFFESGNSAALAEAVLDIAKNKQLRDSLSSRGYEYAERHCWDSRRHAYFELVDALTAEQFDRPGEWERVSQAAIERR